MNLSAQQQSKWFRWKHGHLLFNSRCSKSLLWLPRWAGGRGGASSKVSFPSRSLLTLRTGKKGFRVLPRHLLSFITGPGTQCPWPLPLARRGGGFALFWEGEWSLVFPGRDVWGGEVRSAPSRRTRLLLPVGSSLRAPFKGGSIPGTQ